MKKVIFLLCFVQWAYAQQGPLKFRRQNISSESFETAGVFDVDNDGTLDIVSGSFWYKGPAFLDRFFIADAKRHGEYWDDFATLPMDVNGDGKIDFISGGWWGNNVRWYENPGNTNAWKEHIVGEGLRNVEGIRLFDVDGDGEDEIVPNNLGHPLVYFKAKKDASGKKTGEFDKVQVFEKHGHGLGFGDVNGDGRGDFVISNGWLEAPADRRNGKWILHEEFKLGDISLPVIVADVNKDGKSDLIVGQGHGYGLDWYEQQANGNWKKHPIDPFNSQFHELKWVDIDGDQQPELITGKRYRAHDSKDPGGKDDIGLYYYQWNGESFTKQVIAFGPLGIGKGTGNYFSIADVDKSGTPDIIVGGKDGLVVFYNEGRVKH
jgi:hypothetical protein